VTESAFTQGYIGLEAAGTISSAWAAFATAMAGDNVPLVVASYKLETASLVTTAVGISKCATQRRRQSRLA
jgi:hypothetical protein